MGTPGPGEWWLVKMEGFAGLEVGMTAEVTTGTGVRPGPAGPAPGPPGPEDPDDGTGTGTAPAVPRNVDIGGRLLDMESGPLAPAPAGCAEGWLGAGGTPGDMAP